MQTEDFNFELPDELIAQRPLPERDASRLMVIERSTGQLRHRKFRALLEYLKEGDVLVLNNSKVIPARLRGVNPRTGGKFEMLLLEEMAVNDWWAMLKPGKRAGLDAEIELVNHDGMNAGIRARVAEVNEEGHRRLKFSGIADLRERLDELGEVPLPPYISRHSAHANTSGYLHNSATPAPSSEERAGERRPLASTFAYPTSSVGQKEDDKLRYQTVYAQPPGSVAAPTAGLHFTKELLEEIKSRGVKIVHVTLHVGPGTFAPVKTKELSKHLMHEERFELSSEAASVINEAKKNGARIFAVGTTAIRVLETVAARNGGRLVAGSGRTKLFLYPPALFLIADALVTNFHLPHSTLLMLVSAFAAPGETRGREMILQAYAEAIRERYRFFSYGDAMLILTGGVSPHY